MGFNRVDMMTGVEMEFVVGCRQVALLCYKIKNIYDDDSDLRMKGIFHRLSRQLMGNCDDILIEGINPRYIKPGRWVDSWSEYTQMYIVNVWNITVLMQNLGLIAEYQRDQIISLCDNLLCQIKEIENDHIQPVE